MILQKLKDDIQTLIVLANQVTDLSKIVSEYRRKFDKEYRIKLKNKVSNAFFNFILKIEEPLINSTLQNNEKYIELLHVA